MVMLCCSVVLLDYVVNPGAFSRDIKIVGAVLGAGVYNWGAVKVVWPDCVDQDLGLFGQSIQLIGLETGRLNT